MAQIYVMPPKGEEGESIPEKIRFKSRFAGSDEETKEYDVSAIFWNEDDNGVGRESDDWDIGTVVLKSNIENDTNPSENDIEVFEFLESHVSGITYQEEFRDAKVEGFLQENESEEDV